MVKFYDSIREDHQEWALSQSLFFIASAPSTGRHVNLSPKGQPAATLTIFNGNFVGYLDATGSGIETVSHVYENGRATIMFCSFEKAPRIMRWFCTGRVIETDHPDFSMWLEKMGKKEYPSMRAIILLDVWKVQTSCGFAVPLLTYLHDPEKGARGCFQERKTLENFAIKSIPYPVEMGLYRVKHNARSLDGLPGLRKAMKTKGENIIVQKFLWRAKQTLRHWDSMLVGALLALVLVALLQVLPTANTSDHRRQRLLCLSSDDGNYMV